MEMNNSDALCLQSQSTHKQCVSVSTCLLPSLSRVRSSSPPTSVLLSPTIFLLPISLVQEKDSRSGTGIAPERPGTHRVYDTCKCKGKAKEGRVRRKIRNQPYIFPKAPPAKLHSQRGRGCQSGREQEQLRDPPTLLRLAPPLGAEPLTAQSIRCAWTSSHLAAWAFCVGAAPHLCIPPASFHPHHRSLLPRSIAAMLL